MTRAATAANQPVPSTSDAASSAGTRSPGSAGVATRVPPAGVIRAYWACAPSGRRSTAGRVAVRHADARPPYGLRESSFEWRYKPDRQRSLDGTLQMQAVLKCPANFEVRADIVVAATLQLPGSGLGRRRYRADLPVQPGSERLAAGPPITPVDGLA